MASELEQKMRDQVILGLAQGLPFRAAFANVAHAHRIFHSDPSQRATYNYLYRTVEKGVKNILGADSSTWHQKAQGRQRKAPVVPSPPKKATVDYKRLAAGDIPDHEELEV